MNTTLILIIVGVVVIVIGVIVIKSVFSNKKTDKATKDIGKSEANDAGRTKTLNDLEGHIAEIKTNGAATDEVIVKHEENSLERRARLKREKEAIDAKKNS